MLTFAEVFIIITSSVFGGMAYWLVVDSSVGNVQVHAGIGLIASLIYLPASRYSGLGSVQSFLHEGGSVLRTLGIWTLVFLALTVVLFLFKRGADVSRGSVVCFAIFGALGLVLWRHIARRRVQAAIEDGRIRGRNVVVIGTANELARIRPRDLLVDYGLAEMDRIVLPEASGEGESAQLAATAQRALERARATAAEEFILAMQWTDSVLLKCVLDQLRVSPLAIRLLPDRAVSSILSSQARQPAPVQAFAAEMQRPPLNHLERAGKRLLDIAVALPSLVLVAPVMLVVAAAIKLESPGPVIFRQRRHGFNGREFTIWKFRTMTVMEDGPSVVQATATDRRVTRIGRFLRRASIDEVPQLFNVLSGSMSLVGPRPHPVALDMKFNSVIANYAFRHHMKPGITGWAQVNGYRGETPRLELMEKRIHLDLWYINNWSPLLDATIILRTLFEVIRTRNAY